MRRKKNLIYVLVAIRHLLYAWWYYRRHGVKVSGGRLDDTL
jgi:hypothetical protein